MYRMIDVYYFKRVSRCVKNEGCTVILFSSILSPDKAKHSHMPLTINTLWLMYIWITEKKIIFFVANMRGQGECAQTYVISKYAHSFIKSKWSKLLNEYTWMFKSTCTWIFYLPSFLFIDVMLFSRNCLFFSVVAQYVLYTDL